VECCIGAGLAFVMVIGIVIWGHYKDKSDLKINTAAMRETKEAYGSALEKIKLSPTDPNIRQQALELGRRYAGYAKKAKGPEITEMMIKNDIDAACAGASARKPFSAATEIKKLTELMDEGILTQAEWQNAKNQLVGLKSDIDGVKSNQVDDAVKLLRALHQLVSLGGLTEGEYNMKKWEILSQKLIGPDRPPIIPPKMSQKT